MSISKENILTHAVFEKLKTFWNILLRKVCHTTLLITLINNFQFVYGSVPHLKKSPLKTLPSNTNFHVSVQVLFTALKEFTERTDPHDYNRSQQKLNTKTWPSHWDFLIATTYNTSLELLERTFPTTYYVLPQIFQ